MKILHIHHHYRPFGGGEKYLLDLCSALENKGHRNVIISAGHPQNYHFKNRTEIFVDGSFGFRSGLRMWKIFKDILNKEKPDIIHIHETFIFVSSFIIKRLINFKPTVQTLHVPFYFCPNYTKILPDGHICCHRMGAKCLLRGCLRGVNPMLALNMLWRSYVTRKINKVIVPSHSLQEEAIRNGVAVEKLEVIPHFTQKNLCCEYIEPEKNTILFVGRMDPLKGLSELINALSMIKGLTWKAYVIGSENGSHEYEKILHDSGIEDRIVFTGKLDPSDLDKFYQRASIVVFPSISPEAFGLVGIEAMSFGRPVVSFDVGGPKEWLADEKTGFLVKRGDTKRLSLRISQLLKDGSLAKKFGLEGQKRVNEQYREEMHICKVLSVYGEVIDRRADIRSKSSGVQVL